MIDIIDANKPELAALCRQYRVRRLDLFGSAATGGYDPSRSDLDFVVRFAEAQDMNLADQYFGLLTGLEGLFNRPVDLVTERSITNPYLKRTIDQTRIQIYAAEDTEVA